MQKKVPFNTGMIVDAEGNILLAWKWGGNPGSANPATFEQESGMCVELTPVEHDAICKDICSAKFYYGARHVMHKETGETICLVKNCPQQNDPQNVIDKHQA